MRLGSTTFRLRASMIVLALVLSLLAGRAFQLQGLDSAANAQAAAEKMTHTRTIKATRGSVLDRNGAVLATTQPAVKVIADPASISVNGYNADNLTDEQLADLAERTPHQVAEVLVNFLGGATTDYLPALTRTTTDDGSVNQYEVLKEEVVADTYEQLRQALDEVTDVLGNRGLYGITSEDDPIRVYPSGTLASNIVGFVNAEGTGAGGFEYYADERLAGTDGYEQYESGHYGRIPLADNTLKEAVDGTTYALTIDSELQYSAQQLIAAEAAKYSALSASTVIMNVKTGEILALATTPGYDSNDPGAANPDDLGNRAISEAYEPGSVAKVFTNAVLFDRGLANPDTKVEVPASIASGDNEIRDSDRHADTKHYTARGVFYHSSNIGSALLLRQLDSATYQQYMTDLGFGSASGVELPGEAEGYLPGESMADYTRDNMAFGQGFSTNVVQMAAALAAVTNGGVYHQPTIISSVTDANGTAVSLPERASRRVISEQASAEVLDIMEAVTAGGTGQESRMISGYRMGGKSGTAQMIDEETGQYDAHRYMSSYVTVAPIEDPQVLVYTVVEVQDQYGGTVAMPTSRMLMSMALPRYGVLPSAEVPIDTEPLEYEP
ncbi:peptidoglycan D,D-transpeptidase FtsI family protein [Propionibacterium australiense]|nr:penicillin-binding protein 2 [Propionibacterium australiense]